MSNMNKPIDGEKAVELDDKKKGGGWLSQMKPIIM